MAEHDPLKQQLAGLQIPEAPSNATHRIMQAAMAEKRRQLSWLNWPRQLRAFIYVPSTRMVIMASVVCLFIGIGLVNRGLSPNEQSFDAAQIPDDVLLYDVELVGDDTFSEMWQG